MQVRILLSPPNGESDSRVSQTVLKTAAANTRGGFDSHTLRHLLYLSSSSHLYLYSL